MGVMERCFNAGKPSGKDNGKCNGSWHYINITGEEYLEGLLLSGAGGGNISTIQGDNLEIAREIHSHTLSPCSLKLHSA